MAHKANKACTQPGNERINIFRFKAPIVSQQTRLSRLFKATERGTLDFRGETQHENSTQQSTMRSTFLPS